MIGRFGSFQKWKVPEVLPVFESTTILKELIARVIKCRRTLGLADRIIDGSNEQEEAVQYFPRGHAVHSVREEAGLADRKSDFAVLRQRLSESFRPFRDEGVCVPARISGMWMTSFCSATTSGN
jgi:hypothetical protein